MEVCVLEYQLQVSLSVCKLSESCLYRQSYELTECVQKFDFLAALTVAMSPIFTYSTIIFSHVLSLSYFIPYPQQWRLLPYLAAAFALSHLGSSLFEDFVQFGFAQLMGEKTERQVGSYS